MEDVNSSLQHYKEFNTIFNILRSVFERKGKIINDEIISITKRLLPLNKTMELSAKAIVEIENLLYVQNNNSQRVIDKIVSDCILIEDWIADIGRSNNLITEKKGANFYDLNTNLQDTKECMTFGELHLSFHFFYEPLIKMIKESIPTSNKDHKTEAWFIIGLLFANGEMETLKNQFNKNATQIAIHLGNKNYRPYISSSINEDSTIPSDKNIYSKPDKLREIYNHCIENNITVTDKFKVIIPSE